VCFLIFQGTVKEILGTAVSVGCTVNGRNPRDLQADIDDGKEQVPPQ
jgi:large subunit ribosomal protein L12e